LDDAVLRARDGALDEQEVPLRVDRVHRQTGLRDALAAHAARHADALEHARRRRGRADRARLADVVRAVRDRAAAEPVPLDRALEAFADRRAGNLDRVAGLEDLHGHVLALHRVGEVAAELDQVAVRTAHAVLREVAALRPRDLAIGDRLPRELHGLVAVRVRRAHGDDRARALLDHRDRGDA